MLPSSRKSEIRILFMISIVLFFIGMHNVDNAVNIINTEYESCLFGNKIVGYDTNLVIKLDPRTLYMLGIVMMLGGFVGLASLVCFYLV